MNDTGDRLDDYVPTPWAPDATRLRAMAYVGGWTVARDLLAGRVTTNTYRAAARTLAADRAYYAATDALLDDLRGNR